MNCKRKFLSLPLAALLNTFQCPLSKMSSKLSILFGAEATYFRVTWSTQSQIIQDFSLISKLPAPKNLKFSGHIRKMITLNSFVTLTKPWLFAKKENNCLSGLFSTNFYRLKNGGAKKPLIHSLPLQRTHQRFTDSINHKGIQALRSTRKLEWNLIRFK